MRPAMEEHPVAPQRLRQNSLAQILARVVEEVKESISRDINGAELLYTLLNAPWLQSLLKVYECLQHYLRTSPRPYLPYASRLSMQIQADLSVGGYSPEARALFGLLRDPHLQALLLAHDMVAQKDYNPVLPPLPDDLPDEEEAMRIVCLVKNNQPLRGVGGCIGSHWDTLRKLTRQKEIPSCGANARSPSQRRKGPPRRGNSTPAKLEPNCASASPHILQRYASIDSSSKCQPRGVFWGRGLSRSVPSVCSSVMIDNVIEEINSGDECETGSNQIHTLPHSYPSQELWPAPPPACCPSSDDQPLPPPLPPRIPLHAQSAPSSPMQRPQRQRPEHCPPTELDEPESLDELRCTVQQAACCMERRTNDVCLLGRKMAAATARMSESVQENAQALTLLAEVVDKLQGLVVSGKANATGKKADSMPLSHGSSQGDGPASFHGNTTSHNHTVFNGTPCSNASGYQPPPGKPTKKASSLSRSPPSRRSRCPSCSSSTSSSSSSYLDQPITTHESYSLPVSACATPKTRAKRTGQFVLNSRGRDEQGATIRRDEATGEIFVARVIHGGLADRSGLLHAGDRLVEVNGHPVFGLEPEQIIQILAHCHGTIMFKVVPMTERPVNNQTMLYVRVMVDYSPEQDPTIPCVDAGVAFSKGDVLEIVDQTDALWWQAKKLPSTSACAGLIPSTNFLKRKQREMLWFQAYQPHTCLKALSTVDEEEDLIAIDEKCVETDEETFESEELREDEGDFSSNNSGVYMAGFRRSLRLSRRPGTQIAGTPHCPTNCCWDALETPYEEVVRYLRHPNDTHRVIALVGPSGVGVNELRKRLIEMNPQVYMGAVPHTTRPSRSHEESGREYHFISRELFENMAYNNRFVDYGEYRGHLYGTSMDAIKTVQDSGKICIIDIEPHAILSVRTHELRAYVIYIKPPVAECMRQTRKKSQITTNYYTSRYFKDEEYQEMEEVSKKIESQYCQFFDFVIVNNILQDARDQLLTAVKRAQEEPQWVPAAWIRPSAQN